MATLWQWPAWAAAQEAVWHTDSTAGVRFAVPFSGGQTKTPVQLEALVKDRLPDIKLWSGASDPSQSSKPSAESGWRYTSGVYAAAGLPYILVWQTPGVPTQAQVRRLAAAATGGKPRLGLDGFRFDPAALRGEGRLPERAGLQARVVMQVVAGHTTFVGYFYRLDTDAALFTPLLQSLVVLPAAQLDATALPDPWFDWPAWPFAAVAGLIAAGGVWWRFDAQRRKERAGRR